MKKFLALFAAAAFVMTACTKKEEAPAEVPAEAPAAEAPADAPAAEAPAAEAPAADASSSSEAAK